MFCEFCNFHIKSLKNSANVYFFEVFLKNLNLWNENIEKFSIFRPKNDQAEVCKLCLGQFYSREYLLAHIRRVHERDGVDMLQRDDLFARPRTME